MVHLLIRPCGFGLALLLAGPAWTQPTAVARAAGADPADARAAVPALVWQSSFTRPDGIGLPPALAWKEANDQVQRIGGWRTYAREAKEPEPPAAKPAAMAASGGSLASAPETRPSSGHAGHSGHSAQQKP